MSGTTPATSMSTTDETTNGPSTSPTSSKSPSTASPKKRENKQDKGSRYLVEGRLTVTKVDGDRVVAECRGQGAVYELGFENGHWSCSCPARRDCAHLSALWRVTVRPK